MDFTDLFKQSSYLCRFSPNAKYLATASKRYLVIREATSLQIVLMITWSDIIQNVLWSPDSELILVASYKTGKVTIYQVNDKKWSADIEEGTSGLTNVKWSSDGRTLLCFSDFQVEISLDLRNYLQSLWTLLNFESFISRQFMPQYLTLVCVYKYS